MLAFLGELSTNLDAVLTAAWSPAQQWVAQFDDRIFFTALALLASSGTFLFQYLMVRVLSNTAWWQDRWINQSRQPEPAHLSKALFEDIIKHWIVRPPALYFVAYPLYRWAGMLDSAAALPTFWWMFVQFWVMHLLHAAFFYWIHRILHIPFLYKTIHKQHHEFNITAVPVSEYFHPIEDALNVVIAASMPPAIMGYQLHPVLFYLYMTTLTWDATEAHAGYYFPLIISSKLYFPWFIRAPRGYHDFHHTHNSGAYGRCMFWDWLFGHDIPYNKWMAKKNYAPITVSKKSQ